MALDHSGFGFIIILAQIFEKWPLLLLDTTCEEWFGHEMFFRKWWNGYKNCQKESIKLWSTVNIYTIHLFWAPNHLETNSVSMMLPSLLTELSPNDRFTIHRYPGVSSASSSPTLGYPRFGPKDFSGFGWMFELKKWCLKLRFVLGGLKHVFHIHFSIWGNGPIWLYNIFQVGLKPPTSFCLEHV